jgi:hypothetical protein
MRTSNVSCWHDMPPYLLQNLQPMLLCCTAQRPQTTCHTFLAVGEWQLAEV